MLMLFFLFKYTLVLNCPSCWILLSLLVPAEYLKRFLYHVASSSNSCPARCESAANVVCRNFHLFKTKILYHNHCTFQFIICVPH
jgi:hypothetical protein